MASRGAGSAFSSSFLPRLLWFEQLNTEHSALDLEPWVQLPAASSFGQYGAGNGAVCKAQSDTRSSGGAQFSNRQQDGKGKS